MAERVGFEPTCLVTQTKRFRGAPVTATSVPLRDRFDIAGGHARGLAALAEEVEEQLGRLLREDAAARFHPVVEIGAERPESFDPADGADLEVGGPVNEALDAGVNRRSQAHQAR